MIGGGILWVGFQTLAPELAPPAEPGRSSSWRELPRELPPPVLRFLRRVFDGDRVPEMRSAEIWGRARFRLGPLWAPMRFRAVYLPGEAFVRTMDISWFARPVMRGRDLFVDGRGELAARGWVSQHLEGPELDRAQHLTLWAESVWAPSAWALDPRVEWRPVDATSARLIVPWGDEEDELLARFDAQSGLLVRLSGLRHRGDDPKRRRWRVDLRDWQRYGEALLPAVAVTRWEDQLSPYGIFNLKGAIFNHDVGAAFDRARRPAGAIGKIDAAPRVADDEDDDDDL